MRVARSLLVLALPFVVSAASAFDAVVADDLPPPRRSPREPGASSSPPPPAPPPAPIPAPGTPPPQSPPVPSNASPAAGAGLAAGAASARDALAGALTPADRTALEFLEHLGWQVVEDPSATVDVTIVEGKPGWRASIAEARAAGDLRIVVPTGRAAASAPAFVKQLPGLLDGVATRLAWQHRVQSATEAATRRLCGAVDRGTYTFPRLLGITSPLFLFDPPEGSWTHKGDLYWPAGSRAKAIADFETKPALAECLAAQILGTLAIQLELLGPEAFDEAYTAADASVGASEDYHQTPIGQTLGHRGEGPWQLLVVREAEVKANGDGDLGLLLARYGPMAFPALTGILQDQAGTQISNDNFLFVSMTAEACEILRTRGGFAYVSSLSQEGLDADVAERTRFMTAAKLKPIRERAAAIEKDPVMTGIRVYIHPYGVEPLGDSIRRARKRNHTASEVFLYLCGRDDEYWRRYRAVWIARRLRGANVPG